MASPFAPVVVNYLVVENLEVVDHLEKEVSIRMMKKKMVVLDLEQVVVA
jgi:hypothetical protein